MSIQDDQTPEVFDADGKSVVNARIVEKHIRTMSCDAEGCPKTITFDPNLALQVVAANPWVSNVRIVRTGDNRTLIYCSDECIVKAATSGVMNIPTKKVIDIATGANALQQAIQQAEVQKAVEAGIRSGPR